MTYTVYGMTGSGNCYKPALLMRQLGIDYSWQEVDLIAGQTRTAEFLSRNPNGKVPLLELPDGRLLAESNAMLCYLAEGTEYLPSDRYLRAQVFQWMFFEQYSHEPYIATVRFWVHLLGKADDFGARIAEAMPKGYAALAVMEAQLERTPWLVGEQQSIADIALFAYTHVAHEGGYVLDNYPHINRWLNACRAQKGFANMEQCACC